MKSKSRRGTQRLLESTNVKGKRLMKQKDSKVRRELWKPSRSFKNKGEINSAKPQVCCLI